MPKRIDTPPIILLTELTIRAMEQLHSRLMIINYDDPDYIHRTVPLHERRP